MKIRIIFSIIFLSSLTACWPEDDALEPSYFDLNSKLVTIPNSIYDYQVYYNLSTNELVSSNLLNAWDIGFECSPEGSRIILNTGDLLEVANLGNVDFSSVTSVPSSAEFKFDYSTGNPDSLAFDNWVNTGVSPYIYSDNLYLLGKKEGLNYQAYRKIKFTEVNANSYTMLIGNLDASTPESVTITKDPQYNYLTYKVIGEVNQVNIEPLKSNWDIKMSQYLSILYTEDSIATKYSVRGTLINPYNTSVGKWFINENIAPTESIVSEMFSSIDSTYIDSVEFINSWDAIGWEWKAVTIDEATNTSSYKADPRRVYIIKNSADEYFKLHYISYYNELGVKGYPRFEYSKIR